MAAISEAMKTIETSFMNDYWKLRKEIAEPEGSDTYWHETIDKIDALYDKYKDTVSEPYIKSILLVCADDLETRSRKGTRFERTGDLGIALLNRMRKKRNLPQVKLGEKENK